jgi:ATP-dependent DNA helicase DinG
LNSALIEVAPVLRDRLFNAGRAIVLTSATLSTGESGMSYFAGRIGAEKVTSRQIGSPFDYKNQMKLVVARSMPEPDRPEYAKALPEWIKRYLKVSEGKAFVLFTSYVMMRKVADELRGFCQEQGWKLLVQGENQNRHDMLKEFREDVNSILFGTDSFWTGVDVPGEALSNVIVTRLPFEVPDHPLVKSRIERLVERGGKAFFEYSVPEAILKLRQGVGRLIRTKRDKGMVVILDSRVATKSYGKRFIKALPDATIEWV